VIKKNVHAIVANGMHIVVGRIIQNKKCPHAAYALHDVQYIIQTTHPQSPFYQINKKQWQEELLAFCKNTKFEGLNILQETETTVTFHAQLTQQGEDASFLERSQFELYQGKWMYVRPF